MSTNCILYIDLNLKLYICVQSARHFRRKLNDSIEEEWDNTKNDILDYLGCQRGAGGIGTKLGGGVTTANIEWLLKNTPAKPKSVQYTYMYMYRH